MIDLHSNGRRPSFSNDKTQPSVVGLRWKEVERYDHEEEEYYFERHKSTITSFITIRNKSHLLTFLIILGQFAIVDPMNFLPAGLVLYAIGITIAIEQWNHNTILLEQEEEFVKSEKTRYEELQRRIEQAKFEYHILKNRPKVRIVPIKQPDGNTVIYAL